MPLDSSMENKGLIKENNTGGDPSCIIASFNPDYKLGIFQFDNRCRVSLKGPFGLIKTQETLDSLSYSRTGGTSLSNIFFPFETTVRDKTTGLIADNDSQVASGVMMPSFDPNMSHTLNYDYNTKTHESVVNGGTLLPFNWSPSGSVITRSESNDVDNYGSVLSGEKGSPIKSERDISHIRSVGLKLPAMAVGWGYTLHDDKPAPSGLVEDVDRESFLGDSSSNVDNGWQVDPKHYIAAPIDLRYDKVKNIWTSPAHGFWARLTRQPQSPASGTQTSFYWWHEVSPDGSGNFSKKNLGRYFNNTDASSVGGCYASDSSSITPSGSVVWLNETAHSGVYIFNNPQGAQNSSFWAEILTAVPTSSGSNKWDYTFKQKRRESAGFIDENLGTTGSLINTYEINNSASGIQGNNIDTDNLTGTFSIMPIKTGNVVRAMVDLEHTSSGTNVYYTMSEPNLVDGACS